MQLPGSLLIPRLKIKKKCTLKKFLVFSQEKAFFIFREYGTLKPKLGIKKSAPKKNVYISGPKKN